MIQQTIDYNTDNTANTHSTSFIHHILHTLNTNSVLLRQSVMSVKLDSTTRLILTIIYCVCVWDRIKECLLCIALPFLQELFPVAAPKVATSTQKQAEGFKTQGIDYVV